MLLQWGPQERSYAHVVPQLFRLTPSRHPTAAVGPARTGPRPGPARRSHHSRLPGPARRFPPRRHPSHPSAPIAPVGTRRGHGLPASTDAPPQLPERPWWRPSFLLTGLIGTPPTVGGSRPPRPVSSHPRVRNIRLAPLPRVCDPLRGPARHDWISHRSTVCVGCPAPASRPACMPTDDFQNSRNTYRDGSLLQ